MKYLLILGLTLALIGCREDCQRKAKEIGLQESAYMQICRSAEGWDNIDAAHAKYIAQLTNKALGKGGGCVCGICDCTAPVEQLRICENKLKESASCDYPPPSQKSEKSNNWKD